MFSNSLIVTFLIEQCFVQYCEFAKERKKVANDLCDRQRLGDSYLDVGESYQKLRKFNKAIKWYEKSWKMYKTIGNLEVNFHHFMKKI